MSTQTDIVRVGLELRAISAAAAAAVNRIEAQHALLLETRVKANASGRPGPRVITGDYRRSIVATRGGAVGFGGTMGGWTVCTNAPQGPRLEHGFFGRDRLGRMYQQRPLPHFGPAVPPVEASFLAALHALADNL